jgi:hypothetical protein
LTAIVTHSGAGAGVSGERRARLAADRQSSTRATPPRCRVSSRATCPGVGSLGQQRTNPADVDCLPTLQGQAIGVARPYPRPRSSDRRTSNRPGHGRGRGAHDVPRWSLASRWTELRQVRQQQVTPRRKVRRHGSEAAIPVGTSFASLHPVPRAVAQARRCASSRCILGSYGA